MPHRVPRHLWAFLGTTLILALLLIGGLLQADVRDLLGAGGNGTPIRIGDQKVVEAIAFSPDGQTLAAATTAGVRAWSMPERRFLWALDTGWVQTLTWSPDGQFLAAAQTTIQIWRVRDGTLVSTLTGHTGVIEQIAWSPDGTAIASASRDGMAKLWQVQDGDGLLAWTLQGHTNLVHSVAFSPNGQTMASGGGSTIHLWKVTSGESLRTLGATGIGVHALVFSPDGQLLASTDDNRTIRLWRVADNTVAHRLEGHQDRVNSVAFSLDGQYLISGSGHRESVREPRDTTVRLWRIRDGTLIHAWRGHRDVVTSVAFSPDGQMAVSGSRDGTIRFWPVP